MEEEKKETEIIDDDLLPIAQKKQEEVLEKLVKADTKDEVTDLTNLFNLNQVKRNAIQVNALNGVKDTLIQQMADRLSKTPNNFNNTDIANWMKVVQQALDTSQKGVDQISTMPTIVNQQNTQVNVNVIDNLSKDSRDRIADAIKAIIENNKKTSEDVQEIHTTSVLTDDEEDDELFEQPEEIAEEQIEETSQEINNLEEPEDGNNNNK